MPSFVSFKRGLWASCCVLGALSWSMLARADSRIDWLFLNYDRPDVPGAAVLVLQNGQVRHQRSFGLASLTPETATVTRTNFCLSSISKSFTAMAVMILAEGGKLSFDDPVVKYLPELPAYARPITLRHLLTNTSGLIDYETLIPASREPALTDLDVLELMKKQTRTAFPPGTRFQIEPNNSGYALLALVVERISGQRFASFLDEKIFRVIGMTDTVVWDEGFNDVAARALGYSFTGSRFQLFDKSAWSSVLGAGGVYSSIADLPKWDAALSSESLVSTRTLREAFEPATLRDGSRVPFDFGWSIDSYRGHNRRWIMGKSAGFRTAIQRYPQENLTIVVLINRSEDEPRMAHPWNNMAWQLATKIANLYL